MNGIGVPQSGHFIPVDELDGILPSPKTSMTIDPTAPIAINEKSKIRVYWPFSRPDNSKKTPMQSITPNTDRKT